MNKTKKEIRQDTIEDILSKKEIESQDELIIELKERGFNITQTTLSRDFREMKIAKTPDEYGQYLYRLPNIRLPKTKPTRNGMTSSFSRNGIINIEFSEHFAVIKTPAGYAHGIAHDIDINNISGVMGTIAGNDTVLVILRPNSHKADLITAIKLLFEKNK